jgi:hypothetical protein
MVYQEREGRRERMAGRYLLRGADEIALARGPYDRARPLVIDPVVVYSTRIGVGTARAIAVDSAGPGGDTLIYPTCIGSSWRDFANAVAVDASGNA